MSVLWKKIEFYKGKSVCKAIVFAALGLQESPGGFFGAKDPNFFDFSMSLRRSNGQWHERNYIQDLRSYTSS